MHHHKLLLAGLTLILTLLLTGFLGSDMPVIYLIGDSTVKNGTGKGEGGLWGWGEFLSGHFDTTRIRIENHAKGGRSSRTFQSEGLWSDVLQKLKKGDFVIMQFGHNDAGAINDTIRARGTLRGIGEETEEIDNLITKKREIIHTYGWYIRKYIRDARGKGAIPIVCSPVARNSFVDGKAERTTETYTKWAKIVAEDEGAFFIDLNNMGAEEYEAIGANKVTETLFLSDHIHTNEEGAKINAALVVQGFRQQKILRLTKLLKQK
jgi:rhamnogalacturonan acetylesterase